MAIHTPQSSDILSLPVHKSGRTILAYSRNNELVFTAGTEGLVRIFETAKSADEEPRLLEDHDDEINWLDCSQTRLLTSSSDGSLRVFDLPRRGDPSGPVSFSHMALRAAGLPVRCGVFDPSGYRIACCSDDLSIKILSSSSTSYRVPISLPLSHSTHSQPPRSLAWSPDGLVLLSTGCDGRLVVWDTSKSLIKHKKNANGEEEEEEEGPDDWEMPDVVRKLDGIVADSQPEDVLATTPVWHPSGKFFVIGTKAHEIAVISRESWSRTGKFETGGHDTAIGELAFSPNGSYLASSGVDGKILIWSTENRQVVASYTSSDSQPSPITSIHFSPISNILAFADSTGSFTRWTSPIPSTLPHPAEVLPPISKKPLTRTDGGGREKSPLFGEDEMADEEMGGGAGEGRKGKGRGGVDDDSDGGYGEDWIIDDEDEDGAFKGMLSKGGEGTSWGAGGREVVNVTKAQPAFQPGATPLRVKKRYLAFNMIGSIDITDQDSHYVVNLEFHDTSRRRPFHFQDHSKFEMAALGSKGAIFASLPSSASSSSLSTSHPAVIHYRPFDAWSSSAEWNYDLPSGEAPVAVAVGGESAESSSSSSRGRDDETGMVVIATDKGYLRFLTGSGVQRYLWKMGEEVISIVGGVEEVFVVHREGGTSLDGCQNLRYTLINLNSFDIVSEGRLPLGKQTTLKWLGFSEDGVPAIYDSRGVLSILDRFRRPTQARWVPAVDTNLLARREGKQESYWAVGLQDGKFMAVILKGAESAPYFPRPMISDLDVTMPLLNMSIAQGQLEESYLRQNILALSTRDTLYTHPSLNSSYALSDSILSLQKAMDKSLLMLVQTACKSDKLPRALDAARMLNLPKSIESAVQIAGFYHLPGLKEKLERLREKKEEEVRREEDEEEERLSRGRRERAAAASRYSIPAPKISYAFDPTASAPASYGGASSTSRAVQDFAPRPTGAKRTFSTIPPKSSAPSSSSRFTISSSVDPESSYNDTSDTPMGEIETDPTDVAMENGMSDGEDGEGSSSSMTMGGKRKRGEDDRMAEPFAPVAAKKRGLNGESSEGSMGPPPKPAPPKNPFAKKPDTSAPSNPFARPSVSKTVSIAKSTSFFDRVDEGESSMGKKSKPAKSSTSSSDKQSTLFGLAPGTSDKPKSKAGRPKKKPAAADAESDEATPDAPPKAAAPSIRDAFKKLSEKGSGRGKEKAIDIDGGDEESASDSAVADGEDKSKGMDEDGEAEVEGEEETQTGGDPLFLDEDDVEEQVETQTGSRSPSPLPLAPAPAASSARSRLEAFRAKEI